MPGFAQPGPGQDPDLTETAVLPHTEGPPLVRPYVPSVPVEEYPAPYAPAPADPYATAVLPPAAPYATDPYATAPTDPYATAVLPPLGPNPPGPAPAGLNPVRQESTAPPPRELGLFPIADSQDGARGRAAARRARRRRSGLVAAAGAGVVALGVGLAYVLSPGGSSTDQALPVVPTGAASPSSAPTDSAAPSSAPATTAASASAAPATSARPAAPRTKAAPRTTAPPAPSTSAAAPPPPPATTQAPPPTTAPPTSAAPSPSAALPAPNDSGPAVVALQRQLRSAGCGGTHSGTYDARTANEVAQFQDWNNINADQPGVLDQQTQDALNAGDTC
ncbi:peptidoglycan-binding protein [Kitasatospora acidiphila]|uniref:peptidoglycan-binding protein n=1 Tax=Kitasatospora acidiphila TaxID=2567942 RepID=UPI003C76AF16